MKEDIKKIANTVTEKPIELEIKRDRLSFFDKVLIWLGIEQESKIFYLKPPTMRMCLKITGLLMDIKEVEIKKEDLSDWAIQMRLANTEKMAEIIATYVHGNAKESTPNSLIDFLMDNLKDTDIETIMSIIREQMDIIPFINSIASMKSLDVISQGIRTASLQNTGETIAPGDLSDQRPNISGLG